MSNEIFETIGQRLQQARLKKGWTLDKLSADCGIASSNLSNYEAGARMTLSTLIKIVGSLGVTYDSILSGSNCMVFDDNEEIFNPQNVVNSIEYLFRTGILNRVRISEEVKYSYSAEDAFVPIYEPDLLQATRRLAGSSPYNAVIISYPFSVPVLKYVTSISNNSGGENEKDEMELRKIQKKLLKNEINKTLDALKRGMDKRQ